MTAGGRWIAAIVVLLVGNAVAMVTLAARAGDPAARVIPDYYRKAVSWDHDAEARAASAALGWTFVTTIERGDLVATVHDRAGATVTGATVDADLHPRVRADEHAQVRLTEVAPGRYAAPLHLARHGIHDVALTARRGDAAAFATAVVEP